MGSDNSISNSIFPKDMASKFRLSGSEESEKHFKSTAEVFHNPMLLNEILAYLVLNKDKNISGTMVQSFRLVNKSWFETTSNLLRKSAKPVIILNLDANNSLNESDEVKNIGKLLDQFAVRFGSTSRLEKSFLPYKLNLTFDYFRKENQKSLSNCLTLLGNELTELQVAFPKDGGSMPFIFPQFHLPALKTLVFQFSHQELPRRQDLETPHFGSNRNSLWLLQMFLNVSVNLREVICIRTISNDNFVPRNFELLLLPASIESLKFLEPLNSKALEILFSNQLPNLKTLSVRLQNVSMKNDMLLKIFDRFKETLKSLTVGGVLKFGGPHHTTSLKFPLMKKLEYLRITNMQCEIETEFANHLGQHFPKLKEVCLNYQTAALLAKWVQNSTFETVEKLTLSLVDDQLGPLDPNYYQSMSLEMIEYVHTAFPNVINMSLRFNSGDMSCLKYLFKNMQQLRCLAIDLRGNGLVASKYYIDSILLGLPERVVEVLREHSDVFQSFKLKRDKEPSLITLSELTHLALKTSKFPVEIGHFRPENDEETLISPLLFTDGLLRMRKLTHLNLSGKFQSTASMLKMWKKKGREMTYTSS